MHDEEFDPECSYSGEEYERRLSKERFLKNSEKLFHRAKRRYISESEIDRKLAVPPPFDDDETQWQRSFFKSQFKRINELRAEHQEISLQPRFANISPTILHEPPIPVDSSTPKQGNYLVSIS
ncbi:unnamed protein product, partial [Mesorhabditis spiculigera]